MIASILIGAAIYTLLQVAFIGSLDPALLVSHTGPASAPAARTRRSSRSTPARSTRSPSVAGLAWLAFMLRLDAVVSPFGSGLIYLTTSSRISHALSRSGYIPQQFERTRERTLGARVRRAVLDRDRPAVPAAVPELGQARRDRHQRLGADVRLGALALGALRKSRPDAPRVYRLPAAGVLAPLAFVCATWIIYWSGWQTLTTLMAAMLVGYALVAVSYAAKLNPAATRIEWRAALWIAPYLIGMLVISYFGDFGPGGIIGGIGIFKHVLDHGGTGGLGLDGGLLVSAAWSLAIYHLAVALRLREPAGERSSATSPVRALAAA